MAKRILLLLPLLALIVDASPCRADYYVIGQRTADVATINQKAYDQVSLSLYNDGANGTAPPSVGFDSVQTLAIVLYAPQHGMLISVNGSTHQPDLFGANSEASLPDASWINGNTWSGFSDATGGQQILNGSGASYSVDQANSSGTFSGTYSDLQAVAGISGDFFTFNSANWPNIGPTPASAKKFAQVVVPHGDPVFVLPPTGAPYDRAFPSTQFEPTGTAFGIPTVSGNAGVVPAVNTPGVLGGDANLDGNVNSADLQILLFYLNTTGTNWLSADFNGDGQTNSADLQILLANLNHGSALAQPDASPAPEPTALACAALGIAGLIRRRN